MRAGSARILTFALAALSAAWAAEPALRSVRLEPGDVTLWGARARQRFVVIGSYSDGIDRDLTQRSRFSVADPRLAGIDGTGRLTATAEGETRVEVQVEGRRAAARVRVQEVGRARPFSFARDIGGILTRRGCNASECHGGVKGQAGFKLSLGALYPRDDYRWIVEGGTYQVLSAEASGPKRPRVDVREPEKSLLLLKPTFSIPHGGGKRFAADSADYETILGWVRGGAPYGEEAAVESARIERVEIFPREGVLERGGRQRLLVTAHLSNGRSEDISDEVLYVANNPEVVKVAEDGTVEAVAPGETAVMVRAAGTAVSARFGVVGARLQSYPEVPRNNFIDGEVFAKLRRFNIAPSEPATDSEFLRRVCLDVTGTLPPPERVREFLASRNPHRREKLVEALLDSPEYVDFWTFRFSDLFRASVMSNGAPEHGYAYWQWIRDSIARNRPYDQIARDRIAAQGYDGPSRHYLPYGREPRPEDIMAEDVRVFLGRRLDCAQCHNHPFESWSQDQFWGLAAFFGHLNRTEWTGFGATVMWDDPAGRDPDYGESPDSARVMHPRTRKEVAPAFLDGRPLPAHERGDPRLPLAQWMTSHPYFAETIVNRMWGWFFGRGLVDPVDDFRSTNPPTHPALLEMLARDFREHGHDLKHLVRRIVASRAYQLSSVPNDSNGADRINYSHALARPLEAEVLLDAISAATGIPETFTNSDGGAEPPGTRAIALRLPDLYPSRFLETFGRVSRERVPERSGSANLNQALHMLVGSTYTEKLAREGGRIARLVERRATERESIDELYLAALARFPADAERAELERMLVARPARGEALRDLLWALVTSREFAFNH